MRFLAGIVLGIVLCGVFPELPRATQAWINDLARTVADSTDPTLIESAEEALTNWRAQ